MIKICDINQEARHKLPPNFPEKSGIGSHYADAFIKPMNVQLPDGPAVSCKRKGLKILLKVGDKKGEGLLRRLEYGPDPVKMLDAALAEAARNAGVELQVTASEVLLKLQVP